MNFFKRFLFVFSIMVASTVYYPSSVAAEPIEKVLTLSVGFSTLHNKDVPKLSMKNGPLVGDESSIGLAIDMKAVLNLFVERNLHNGRAEFKIKYVDGTLTSKTFSIAPNAPDEAVINLPELILGVEVNVTGTNVTGTVEKVHFDPYGGRPIVNRAFRPLVSCRYDGIYIESAVDHPEIQRILINKSYASKVDLDGELNATGLGGRNVSAITTKSQPVQTGAEFKEFTANLENFGKGSGPSPRTTLEVTRENDTLKLRMLTLNPDGTTKYDYILFIFKRCSNAP